MSAAARRKIAAAQRARWANGKPLEKREAQIESFKGTSLEREFAYLKAAM
jgi:hypothetical protein